MRRFLPRRWAKWLDSLDAWIMDRFNGWFCSAAGVRQTFLITMSVVVVEHVFPHLDPSGFLLLYWLTVYSGITQPALAYSAAVSARTTAALEARMLAMEEQVLSELAAIKDQLAKVTR